jgi:hypothetical protein
MRPHRLLSASLLAAGLVLAAPALAQSTIMVPNGQGGMMPYVHDAPPSGPNGISVDDGHGGWKPYTPKPKPGPGISVQNEDGEWVPYKPLMPHRRAPRPVKTVHAKNGWTYYLMQDRDTGQMFLQIEDGDGRDIHINGEVRLPGGAGPLYEVR